MERKKYVLGIILVFIFFKIYFFYDKKGTQQDIILVYNILLIPLSLFTFILDLLFKPELCIRLRYES